MGPHVHMNLTRQWALEEGFGEREAELVAVANLAFDSRYPARASFANITKHFAPTAWAWSARYLSIAVRGGDLMMLGYALHCAQDGVAHGRLGEKHLLTLAGLGRHPDFWDRAPRSVQRRIEAVTRHRLRRFVRDVR
ncbi:MAG: hypothetical protein EG823_03780 [Actinobacteria bacterium]|nr:hypothetical protein [Actinomycetota bacterium]